MKNTINISIIYNKNPFSVLLLNLNKLLPLSGKIKAKIPNRLLHIILFD